MDLFSLHQKTAVVTGALGLIGKKHCEALALAGANVVVADVNSGRSAEFAQELGSQHIGIGIDVTNKTSVTNALNQVITKYG